MIKLEINNSTSQIIGLSPTQFQELSLLLSTEEIAYGYTYLNLRHLPKLKVRGGVVYLSDVKHIPRPVVNRRFQKFSSIAAVKQALESKDYAMSKGHILKRKMLLSKKGEFASGLLGRVEAWLSSVPHQAIDVRKRPASRPGMFNLNLDGAA